MKGLEFLKKKSDWLQASEEVLYSIELVLIKGVAA